MTGIGLLVVFALIRAYYRRKWEGAHPGAPLNLGWIKKRIDCSQLRGEILSCHYEKARREHVFLVQDGPTLEWHIARHSWARGWVMD
jgi:hypothetical protein